MMVILFNSKMVKLHAKKTPIRNSSVLFRQIISAYILNAPCSLDNWKKIRRFFFHSLWSWTLLFHFFAHSIAIAIMLIETLNHNIIHFIIFQHFLNHHWCCITIIGLGSLSFNYSFLLTPSHNLNTTQSHQHFSLRNANFHFQTASRAVETR